MNDHYQYLNNDGTHKTYHNPDFQYEIHNQGSREILLQKCRRLS